MAVAKTVWLKSTASGNALTIAPDAGDFLIGWSTADGTYTITTPSGWTPIGSLLNTNAVEVGSTAFFYRRADGTETSVTFLWTSNNSSVDGVAAFDNVNTDNPFDVTPVTDAHDTSDTVADTSITPTTDGCKIAYIVVGDGSSGTYTFTFSTQSGTTGAWSSPNEALVAGGYYNFAMNCCVQQTAGPITARCVVSTQCSRPALLVALRKAFDTHHGDLSETDSVSESVETTLRGGSVSLEDQVSVAEHGGVTSPFAQRDFVQNDFGQVFPAASSGQTYTEGVNESASVAEQGILHGTAVQGVSDSHTAGEFAGAVATANQALNDSVGVVENLLAQGIGIAGIAEALGITEGVAAGLILAVALAEAVTKGDGIGSSAQAIAGLTDSDGLGEAVASGGTTVYTEALAESAGISESAASGLLGIAVLTDSHAIADAIAAAFKAAPGVADALGLTEAQTTTLSSVLGIADTLSHSEGIAASLQAILALSDAIASVESLLASRITLQGLAESTGITESQSAGIVLAALLSETVANDGSIASLVSAIQGLAETGNISDGISTGGVNVYTVTLDDGTTLSDAASAAVHILAGLTDSGGIAEALANAVTFGPAVAEAHGLTEQQMAQMSQLLALADQLADAATMTGGLRFAVEVLEQCQVADELAAGLQARQDLVDNHAVQGALASYQAASQALSEAIGVTDGATAGRIESVGVVEALAIADAALAAQQALAALTDSLASAESMAAVGGQLPDVINNAVRAAVAIECVPRFSAPIECVPRFSAPIECVPPIMVCPIA